MPTIPSSSRVCTACGTSLPVEDFYFKDRTTGQRMARCKSCYRARTMAAYNQRTGRPEGIDRRTLPAPIQAEKQCSSCGIVKVAAEFEARADRPNRLRSSCHACRLEEKARYDASHRDRLHIAAARYRDEQGEALSVRQQQWRKDHPERTAAIAQTSKQKHHARVIAYNRQWRQAHPDLCNVHKHNRKARQTGNGGTHTVAEWAALKASYDHTCLRCGKREPEVTLTKDHVIPVVAGGSNWIENLQPLCLPCNMSKGTRRTDYRR